jgi:hypothetical protein
MMLGFKRKFPWEAETLFKEKVLAALWVEKGESPLFPVHPKLHTCREDKGNRWGKGASIHFAYGVRTKELDIFYVGECLGTQKVKILPSREEGDPGRILVDDRQLKGKDVLRFAKNDGFDSLEDFWRWFGKDFSGTLIHWTKLRY